MYQEIVIDKKYEPTVERSEDKDIYYQQVRELKLQFKKDVLALTGLTNHKNADKVFEYAWEQGHSSGYYEVYQTLEELSELFD